MLQSVVRHLVRTLFVAIVAAPLLLAQDSTKSGPFSIRGSVRDSADNPIASAVVSVLSPRRSATTDASGEFVITGLPAETRVVEVVAFGYRSRAFAIAISGQTQPLVIALARAAVVLDSVRTRATSEAKTAIVERKQDRITEAELARPELAGRNAMDALALLRPQLLVGRAPGGGTPSEAARRGQLYPRDASAAKKPVRATCSGGRACDIDSQLSVSIDEGPLGSPDILSTLSVAGIREMKYLLPVDATARFGVIAGNGPVLIVYTK